jgi:NAD+ synthetase
MRIGLAQINTTVGDLEGNVERCLAAVDSAARDGADLVVLPELAVTGYPPRDILCDESFVEAAGHALDDLASRTSGGPAVVVGAVIPAGRRPPRHPGLHNAAVLLDRGRIRASAAKRLLPAYDVFYEPRWFLPGAATAPIEVAGRQLGLLVCEDLWDEGYAVHPADELRAAGADLLVSISASPYWRGVAAERLHQARRARLPVVYVNACGATDELVFDGASFVTDPTGAVLHQLASFTEEVRVVDVDGPPGPAPQPLTPAAALHTALTLGIRDFAVKNGLDCAFLGLSGGIDSSLVAVLAADALGPERVTGLAIPSRHTDPRSTACAKELARDLGIGFETVELEPLHAAAEASLAVLMDGGTTAENVQARLRAMVLMSHVNHHGGLLLNTSNKTELALGYATLYGDMAGGLAPIADLTKLEVVGVARWVHANRGLIPDFVLDRPPSAELRPDQVDPFDYVEVAPMMEALVRANQSDAALRRSEHKRWQFGVVLKVSPKAFGTGRMIPITRR